VEDDRRRVRAVWNPKSVRRLHVRLCNAAAARVGGRGSLVLLGVPGLCCGEWRCVSSSCLRVVAVEVVGAVAWADPQCCSPYARPGRFSSDHDASVLGDRTDAGVVWLRVRLWGSDGDVCRGAPASSCFDRLNLEEATLRRTGPFVLDIPKLRSPAPSDLRARWDGYRNYIRSLQADLPPGAVAYGTSDAHTDYSDRMSPHDGWLDRLIVEEPAMGQRSEERSIRIVIELLGSYHDGRIRFTYPSVRSYTIGAPKEFEMPPLHVGHGDWLADELSLSDDGFVVHEILFSRGAHWRIEASDIRYEWLPLETR
jgi:hypothetical protein